MTDNERPEPAQIEAEGIETIEVKFRNEVFTFPASMDDAPLSVMWALRDQDFATVIEGILSKDDVAKLLAIPGIRIKDAGVLFNEYAAQVGLPQVPQ